MLHLLKSYKVVHSLISLWLADLVEPLDVVPCHPKRSRTPIIIGKVKCRRLFPLCKTTTISILTIQILIFTLIVSIQIMLDLIFVFGIFQRLIDFRCVNVRVFLWTKIISKRVWIHKVLMTKLLFNTTLLFIEGLLIFPVRISQT